MTRMLVRVPATRPLDLMVELRRALDLSGPAVTPVPEEEPSAGEPEEVPQPVGVVIETSGSTGVPKRVALTCNALLASAAASATALDGQGQWLLALPAHYIAGLQVLVRSIAAGTVPVVLPPGRFDPAAFVEASRTLSGELHYTSLVPLQLARLLDSRAGLMALRRFDGILVGGQATPPQLLRRTEQLGLPIFRTYGSSETAGGCVYNGVPLPGVHVRVVDGEVELAGPMLAEGYLGDEELTERIFPVADGFRWYRTGDLGEFSDGVLRVTGRADNVINSGGVNVSLDRVEHVVRGLPDLTESVVVAGPHRDWGEVPVVVTASGHPSLSEIADAVAESLGKPARPAHIVRLDELPLLPSGKPDRLAIVAIVAVALQGESGDVPAVGPAAPRV
ncbi:AMP-binding protein [Mycetocola miduiensis]|uniref:O-succinylbenzoic acid--CoA ligase n=1 Tax=Mycetocola miduiensis TaxID=995034 RepID=A0A1I4YML8_9MICO|nr:AMP-binding protein [Mycetocola miduiensis]SFN38850.1 O-succinylbenzoic acid--CoA ligase [Mycetocola miduiensis]